MRTKSLSLGAVTGTVTALVMSWCCELALAGPENDRLTFSGHAAPGVNTVTFTNNRYEFWFSGDEQLRYTLDLSDPRVARGELRVREEFSGAYPVDGGGPIYRDPNVLPTIDDDKFWFPFNINGGGTVTLVAHAVSGNTVTLDYNLLFHGVHPYRYELSIEGKVMRVRFSEPTGNLGVSNNFTGSTLWETTGVSSPKPVKIQGTLGTVISSFVGNGSGFFISSILDMFHSNASDYAYPEFPQYGVDKITQHHFETVKLYKTLSNTTLAAPLDDAYAFVVTRFIKDVLITSTAPASPYRAMLANRMVFDGPETCWTYYSQMYDSFFDLGMFNVAGYFFSGWTTSADDPPLDYNAGPDWFPAVNNGCSPLIPQVTFQEMLKNGAAYGFPIGAYVAFNSLPASASPEALLAGTPFIARKSDGTPKRHNFACLTSDPSSCFPLLTPEGSRHFALKEANLLKGAGAGAVYVDIQTYGSISKGPEGDHIDEIYNSGFSQTMRGAFLVQKGWLDESREITAGPMLGEGSISDSNANMEFLYYGYVDSVQRCINTGIRMDASQLMPAEFDFAPTQWPIIPEYEWHVAAKKQVNHGNGFYDRFFSLVDGGCVVNDTGATTSVPPNHAHRPLTQDARDLYNAFAITYGHTGFIITNGDQMPPWSAGYLTYPAQVDTYFMTNALQTFFYLLPVTAVRYWQGQWKAFESILFAANGSTNPFRHIPVAIAFQGGLTIYVNHGATPLTITDQGATYTLPPKTGWYASLPGLLQCFSAIPGTSGSRIDYCNAIGQYEYFNGRGQVSGYGSLSTPNRRIKYHIVPTNVTVEEGPAAPQSSCTIPTVQTTGILNRTQGPQPALQQVVIVPGNGTLSIGERTGLKAYAQFVNGGLMDVTTLLDWYSTKPQVAAVNAAGVVKGKAPGTALLVLALGNQPIATTTVTVQ